MSKRQRALTESKAARAARPGNLRREVGWRPRLQRTGLAIASGMLMAVIFAPLEWAWWSWFGLVPLLLLACRPVASPLWLGLGYGLGHFTLAFAWIREVFLLAPFGIALICAWFPALWAWFCARLLRYLSMDAQHDTMGHDPNVAIPCRLSEFRQCVFVLLAAASWVALEWVRGWIFTGLPWDLLGVSQWQNGLLILLTRWTGIWGISFLIAAVNATVFLLVFNPDRRLRGFRRARVAPAMTATLLGGTVLSLALWRPNTVLPPPDASIRIAAVQGNIPQNRVWSEESLNLALTVYAQLTREIVASDPPDLVLWPETAIPASLLYQEECRAVLPPMFAEIQTPLLAGSLDYRLPPPRSKEQPRPVNSALLFDRNGMPHAHYDKMHLVPFGEFVPFERHLPWLVDWIGMGRGLLPGREYTIFEFGENTQFGVNICYEDIFPEISANFVRRGANLLVTLTNDAWFRETSGSRQHFAHSVIRAVENARPMIRNGNNSDSGLILPDGRLVDMLVDENSRFVRAARTYDVPIWTNQPITLYTRFGDWFAQFATLASGLALLWCFYRIIAARKRLRDLVLGPDE
jgi:apolipoprotein N-acyltransferase